MRLFFAMLALALVGCSSTSSSSKRGGPGSQSTPRAQAAEVNLGGTSAGVQGGATGGGSGGPTAVAQPTPGVQVAPPGDSPAAANGTTARRPPIEPGLARMPGYQPSLLVTNAGSDTLARGYNLYKANCAMCHGADLRGELSAPGMPMRDLTKFKEYKFGSTDQAIYRTIVYGIPKTAMGNSQTILNAQQVWDVINYMKSRRTDPT